MLLFDKGSHFDCTKNKVSAGVVAQSEELLVRTANGCVICNCFFFKENYFLESRQIYNLFDLKSCIMCKGKREVRRRRKATFQSVFASPIE